MPFQTEQPFAGDKKATFSLLMGVEKKLIDRFVPFVPLWLETQHLTLLTFLWSAGILVFSFLAQKNLCWIWGVNGMIVLQYVTDVLDGAVGRYRNTGLIKWGYYMDHFLDYVFLCSMILGYAFLVPHSEHILILSTLALSGAFMVNAFLTFSVTNEFEIAQFKVGPTEIRIAIIGFNTWMIFHGTGILIRSLPLFLIFTALCLAVILWKTQRKIWKLDMDFKSTDRR